MPPPLATPPRSPPHPGGARAAPIDRPIDRNELLEVKRRFLRINQTRLRRVCDSLPPGKRIFFDVLPLLFHANHPLMPGYAGKDCPCGIAAYAVDKRALARARQVARSFDVRAGVQRQPAIHALFLMGSCGTIGQSGESDFDFWLCHRPDLAAEQVERLRAKAAAIEAWAETLGVEAHFFTMSADDFRDRGAEQLSSESSGTAQRYLLLDEFYRSSLHVVGRMPIWWLIPPDREAEYHELSALLLGRRFVKPEDWLDFGSIADCPAGEFFGATLWQLAKAIGSPYKSILKLLLLEVYAASFPETELLSTRFKRRVYEGRTQTRDLDPYLLMYRTIASRLERLGDAKRLELARRCLYFKVNRALSRTGPGADWTTLLMREVVEEWGWGEEALRAIDARHAWKVEQALAERQVLLEALTHSYRFLSNFARHDGEARMVSEHDMTVLGRKLFAAFESRAGKIDIINHSICDDLSEPRLFLEHVEPRPGLGHWAVYKRPRTGEDDDPRAPIKRGRSLPEAVAWCYLNGVLGASTRLVVEDDDGLIEHDLSSALVALRRQFPAGYRGAADVEALGRDVGLAGATVFLDFPLRPERGGDDLRHRGGVPDAPGAALAQRVDYLSLSTWGEHFVHHFSGADALIRCLCEHLSSLSRPGEAPPMTFCYAGTRGGATEAHTAELFDTAVAWWGGGGSGLRRRLVLPLGERHGALVEDGTVSYELIEGEEALWRYLARPSPRFTRTELSGRRLEPELRLALEENREGLVQLFYSLGEGAARIVVLDENGALLLSEVSCYSEASLLNQYRTFFDTVELREADRLRSARAPGSSAQEAPALPVEYFSVEERGGSWALRRVAPRPGHKGPAPFQLRAVAYRTGEATELHLYCNDQEFSSRAHGARLFSSVAEYVVSRRPSAQPYPVFLTDLDLTRCRPASAPGGSEIGVLRYLRYKWTIERNLNAMLNEHGSDPSRSREAFPVTDER